MYAYSKEYWKVIVLRFLEDADTLRIDCWNNETECIEILNKLCKNVDTQNCGNMYLFTFDVTEEVIDEIVHNGTKNNKVKWFSLFLMKAGKIYFSFEHYGIEGSLNYADRHDKQYIKYFLPKGSQIT